MISHDIPAEHLDSHSWETINEGLEDAESARNLKEFCGKAAAAASRLVPNDSGAGCFSFERGLLRWLAGDPEEIGEGFNEKYRYALSSDRALLEHLDSGILDLGLVADRDYVREYLDLRGVRYSLGALDGDFQLCVYRSSSKIAYQPGEVAVLRILRSRMAPLYHWIKKAESALLLAAAPPGIGSRPGLLTRRELEVLRCLERGMSAREIGIALEISPRTAERHTANVYDKLGVLSRKELAERQYREGCGRDRPPSDGRPMPDGRRSLLGHR